MWLNFGRSRTISWRFWSAIRRWSPRSGRKNNTRPRRTKPDKNPPTPTTSAVVGVPRDAEQHPGDHLRARSGDLREDSTKLRVVVREQVRERASRFDESAPHVARCVERIGHQEIRQQGNGRKGLRDGRREIRGLRIFSKGHVQDPEQEEADEKAADRVRKSEREDEPFRQRRGVRSV